MMIQSLLVVGLLVSVCGDLLANGQTPPNNKGRSKRGSVAKDTPRPPRKGAANSGASAAAAEPAASAEADGKDAAAMEEAIRNFAKLTGKPESDVRRLAEDKGQVVGNGTLKDIKNGTDDLDAKVKGLEAKLAAKENELKAFKSKTANYDELVKQSEADRKKMESMRELQKANTSLETKYQEIALDRDKAAADLKKALADLEDARSQAQKESEEAEARMGTALSGKNTEKLELEGKLTAAERAMADLRKAEESARQTAEERAKDLANAQHALKAKETELAQAQRKVGQQQAGQNAAPAEVDVKKLQADLDAAARNQKAAEDAAANAKRALDEAEAKHGASVEKIKASAQDTSGLIHVQRQAAQDSAKFYQNLAFSAAGALAVGGGALVYRVLTAAPRLATRVKKDEMITFVASYEGSEADLVSVVVKNFGEPAKSDRAMFVKLDSKLVERIDLLEEFLSWKQDPLAQEFIDAEETLLRLLMVRASLLKLMPGDEPVAESAAAA